MIDNRTSATCQILMNWKGLDYQPIELGREIYLEGPNGAGKTTVMMGQFIVLMPDLRLLEFRPIGETNNLDKDDKGIYVRLGDGGNAYAILEFRTGNGNRLFAGVEIIKKTRPQLELRMFVIEGVDWKPRHDEVLCGRDADGAFYLPTLQEMQVQVVSLGGKLTRFNSIREYGDFLFANGILPVRLGNRDEREKFNRLLRASMMGGLSGDIQKSLREYLLAEDNSISETSARWRENLIKCRSSRIELEKTENTYREIHDFHRNGSQMALSAFHAARNEWRAHSQKCWEARLLHRQVKQKWLEASMAAKETGSRLTELRGSLETLEEEDRQARYHLENSKEAHQLKLTIDRQAEVCAGLQTKHGEASARQGEAKTAYDQAAAALAQTEERQRGLGKRRGDLQTAFTETISEAARFDTATATLHTARQLWPEGDLAPDAPVIELRQAQARQTIATLGGVWSDLDSEISIAESRRRQFAEALGGLEAIVGRPVAPVDAFPLAQRIDEEYRQRARQVEDAADLPERIEAARTKSAGQQRLAEILAQLKAHDMHFASPEALRQGFTDANSRLDALLEQEQLLMRRHTDAIQSVQETKNKLSPLLRLQSDRQKAIEKADPIGKMHGVTLLSSMQIDRALRDLRQRMATCEAERTPLQLALDDTQKKIEQLINAGGNSDERLAAVAESVAGGLVSELYEDVDIDDAAQTQARLGPLHDAIRVANVRQAAQVIAQEGDDRPDTVWLIDETAAAGLPDAVMFENAALVQMGDLWRLTTLPEQPVVGHNVRTQRIQTLKADEQELASRLEGIDLAAKRAKATIEDIEPLHKVAHWLDSEDPEPEIQRLDQVKHEQQAFAHQLQKELDETRAERARLNSHEMRLLAAALPYADYLDGTDWAQRLSHLLDVTREVTRINALLEQHRQPLAALRKGGGVLRLEFVPPTEDALEQLTKRRDGTDRQRRHWRDVEEQLTQLLTQLPNFAFEASKRRLESGMDADVLASIDAELDVLQQKIDGLMAGKNVTEAAWQGAVVAFNEVDADFKTQRAELELNRGKLERLGLAGSEAELARAVQDASDAARNLKKASDQHDALKAEHQQKQAETQDLERQAAGRLEEYEDARLTGAPACNGWRATRNAARTLGFFVRWTEDASFEMATAGHRKLQKQATAACSEILARLGHLDQTSEVVAAFKQAWEAIGEDDPDRPAAVACIHAWQQLRSYLEQLVPATVVQSVDPLVTLTRMAEHIDSLKTRLASDELLFQEKSTDLANGIKQRINRETGRINRLNSAMRDIRFGTVSGIRIHCEQISEMGEFLTALQEQRDLFADWTLPIEETLSKLYEQVSHGGKVRGELLLDYRNYLKMTVQVQKHDIPQWVTAGASTGESIGVGAAVLMMILDSWERTAQAWRGSKKLGQSLRLLFLDEASRLDSDSLTTLASLCDRMQVQMVVACPSVEQVRSGYVYRLHRKLAEDGQEEVVVKGRRESAPPERAEADV